MFDLNELQRGVIATIAESFQLLGIIVGVMMAPRAGSELRSDVLAFLGS